MLDSFYTLKHFQTHFWIFRFIDHNTESYCFYISIFFVLQVLNFKGKGIKSSLHDLIKFQIKEIESLSKRIMIEEFHSWWMPGHTFWTPDHPKTVPCSKPSFSIFFWSADRIIGAFKFQILTFPRRGDFSFFSFGVWHGLLTIIMSGYIRRCLESKESIQVGA